MVELRRAANTFHRVLFADMRRYVFLGFFESQINVSVSHFHTIVLSMLILLEFMFIGLHLFFIVIS